MAAKKGGQRIVTSKTKFANVNAQRLADRAAARAAGIQGKIDALNKKLQAERKKARGR